MGVVLVKGFYIASARVFINSCILKELFFGNSAIFKADGRNILHVNLNALSRELHLFIRFRDVLWILRMNCCDAMSF